MNCRKVTAMIETEVQQELSLSEYQTRILEVPEEFDIFLGGGRGGGKSYGLALLILRHVEQYAKDSRALYLRKTYKGLADFESLCREVFGMVYGTAARYNASEHVWRFPNGAYLELGQLESEADYAKYQGRSFNLLLVDEAGQYSSPVMLDRLRSNLRGPRHLPIRLALAANPGGPGHQWLSSRYVFQAGPWVPFNEAKSNRTWVYCPGTFQDNPHIDREQYAEQLKASCPHDPELARAWLQGDWSISRGAFFAGVLSEKRSGFTMEPKPLQRRYDLSTYLAMDWGSSAPMVAFLCGIAQGDGFTLEDRHVARGSIIILDEVHSARPDDWNTGLNWTTETSAEAVKEMCKAWGVAPHGVVDSAVFAAHGSSQGSIGHELRRCGLRLSPAKKGMRADGWQIMRQLMKDAGKPDRPGLYVSRRCAGFWNTAPMLARDLRRVEDLDTGQADHWADACRYGLLYRPCRPSGQRFWR